MRVPLAHILGAVALLLSPNLVAQQGTHSHATAPSGSAEARTTQRLEAIRDQPPALRAFLLRMPKGGDLHMHLSGAVYAETFLANAAQDNLCADPVKLVLLPNIGTTRSIPAKPSAQRAPCPPRKPSPTRSSTTR